MKYITLCFCVCVFFACASKKQADKKTEYPFTSIQVGSSGGFTGAASGFIVQDNGEIYVYGHQAGRPYQQQFLRSTTLDSVNMVFDKVLKSGIHDDQYNKPGNMTYTMVFKKDSSIHSISWSDGQDSIQSYIEMYRFVRGFASGRGGN